MTAQSHRRTELSRLAIAGAFLLAGLGATAPAVSAGPPVADDGGSGSGGSTVASDRPIFLEHFGLVPTNGGPGSFVMNPEPDGPTLVGSGPDRETVAVEVEGPTLVGSGPDRETVAVEAGGPTLVGSGTDREIVAVDVAAGTLDETARSIELGKVQSGPHVASGTLSDADIAAIISASGGNGQVVFESASSLDEAARSQDLIALSPSDDSSTAVARNGQPY